MTDTAPTSRFSHPTEGLVIMRPDIDPTLVDFDHISELLEAAMTSALDSALHNGEDVPVGAAASKDGRILAINYAQDNSLHDPQAHAEYMTMRLAEEKHPGVHPDTIAVTLEPCTACQNYLAEFPDLKVVAFTLPLASASLRHVVRTKETTIFDRLEHDKLPYTVIQLKDERQAKLGKLLLNVTSRDLSSGDTSIDVDTLQRGLAELL